MLRRRPPLRWGRFETEMLAITHNRNALADMPGQWIDAVHDRQELSYITLDMDSSVSPTHGAQEGTAWNGHFGCNCYHPLFIFNQFGHLERCALRNGNVHSADDWKALLAPVIARYAERDIMRFFRGDAAFAIPELYETLEAAGYFYAIRLKKNAVLEEKIGHRLTRPVGRPSKTKVKRFYETFEYQAASWGKPRQVVAKIEWHPRRVVPAPWLHRDQYSICTQRTVSVLQPARHRRGSISRKARTPSLGPVCRASGSVTMRSGFSCTHWLITSVSFFRVWIYRKRLPIGL